MSELLSADEQQRVAEMGERLDTYDRLTTAAGILPAGDWELYSDLMGQADWIHQQYGADVGALLGIIRRLAPSAAPGDVLGSEGEG